MRGIYWILGGAAVIYLFYMSSGSRAYCSFPDWIMHKCGAAGSAGVPL